MKYAHNTVLLFPLIAKEEQKKVVELSFTHDTLPNGKRGRVSIMGTPTRIAAITCTLPEPEIAHDGGPTWSAEESTWVNAATNHMLTTIQLGYDSRSEYFGLADHEIVSFSNFSDEEIPIFAFEAELIGERPIIDAEVLTNSYSVTASRGLQHIMGLLSEGASRRIPAHYRFLALYKIIELEHPSRSADFHTTMDQQYQAVKAGARPLRNLLPQLRSRIAHAMATGATEPGLSGSEQAAVISLIPIMQNAIHADISQRYGIRMTLTPGFGI